MLFLLFLVSLLLLYFKPLLGAFVIGLGYYLLTDFDAFVEDVKPPKMKAYGIDIFPLVKKIFKLMPDSTRKNIAIKMVNIQYQFSLEQECKAVAVLSPLQLEMGF